MTSLQHEVDKQRVFFYESGLDGFSKICTDVLEKHAPCKKKKKICEQITNLFINPEISKVIMTRTKLKNCFLKKRSDENRQLFCKQINKCVSML